MRWMRALGALIGALATGLALVLLGAAPSVAGGPTSVLLASPTSGETASLYMNDEDYKLLERLLGRTDGTGGTGGALDEGKEKPPKLDETIGHSVNVTWLIHDVSPWRFDQVYPLMPESRGVWIHTSAGAPDGTNGTWHKAQHPEELRHLLAKLGVMGKLAKSQGPDAKAGRPSADDAAAAAASGADDRPPAEAATASTELGTNWWWSMPGLAAGAALALTLRPLAARTGWQPPTSWQNWWRQRREPREPGPRQELRDV